MNVIGIICEYNPFHNGHLYQINKIKEMFKDSTIIAILNGNFTQRGDVSIIDKWIKTDIALFFGIDLIIELPLFYGINNSNIFASGALKILNDLHIDTLVFGTETFDIDTLKYIANIKINNKEYDKIIKKLINDGKSYPDASFTALNKLTNITINKPNDILALSYVEEIISNNYKINPISIKRINNYHDKEINNICSATAVRNAVLNNTDISNSVPKTTLDYLKEPIFIDKYFKLLKYKILYTNDLSIYHDVNIEISSRIKNFINVSNTYDELINKVKTRRYTYNKIKRILLYILLDIKKDIKVYDYIRPLGFNNKGSKYLNGIKKHLTLPLISNYNKNKDLLNLEYTSDSIYALGFNNPLEELKKEYNKPIKK